MTTITINVGNDVTKEFREEVKKKFGRELFINFKKIIIFKSNNDLLREENKGQNRKITSLANGEASEESILILVLILGILGAIGIKMGRSL